MKPTISGNIDGNVFAILAGASRALKRVGLDSEEMKSRVFASSSYNEALAIMQEYVDFELD